MLRIAGIGASLLLTPSQAAMSELELASHPQELGAT